MAIFGVGAYYDHDVSNAFLEQGWAEEDAPPAHAILRHLRAGDIIFVWPAGEGYFTEGYKRSRNYVAAGSL